MSPIFVLVIVMGLGPPLVVSLVAAGVQALRGPGPRRQSPAQTFRIWMGITSLVWVTLFFIGYTFRG